MTKPTQITIVSWHQLPFVYIRNAPLQVMRGNTNDNFENVQEYIERSTMIIRSLLINAFCIREALKEVSRDILSGKKSVEWAADQIDELVDCLRDPRESLNEDIYSEQSMTDWLKNDED